MSVGYGIQDTRNSGMWDTRNIEDGTQDTRNIEDGIQDENIVTGSGCAHFSWWDAG